MLRDSDFPKKGCRANRDGEQHWNYILYSSDFISLTAARRRYLCEHLSPPYSTISKAWITSAGTQHRYVLISKPICGRTVLQLLVARYRIHSADVLKKKWDRANLLFYQNSVLEAELKRCAVLLRAEQVSRHYIVELEPAASHLLSTLPPILSRSSLLHSAITTKHGRSSVYSRNTHEVTRSFVYSAATTINSYNLAGLNRHDTLSSTATGTQPLEEGANIGDSGGGSSELASDWLKEHKDDFSWHFS